MKVRFNCDNNANIHSKKSQIFTTEELGYSDKDWNSLSQEEKEEECKNWAYEHLDIWFEELK